MASLNHWLYGEFPKMVDFPNNHDFFPHKLISTWGVKWGIPPFKETPIWSVLRKGILPPPLRITSRLWPPITSWSFPTSTDVEEDGFQCGISGWKRLGSDDAWPPQRRAEAEGPVKDSTLRRQNWQFSQGNIYTPEIGTQKWRWMEDDFPFQLGDAWVLC